MSRFSHWSFIVMHSISSYLMFMTSVTNSTWLVSKSFISSINDHSGSSDVTNGLPCDLIPGLNHHQRKLCSRHPAIMRSVGNGVRLGVSECQFQFADERWNCTTKIENGFANIALQVGSREEAFTYSITSAGIVYSIAEECSKGVITKCGCDHKFKKGQGGDKQGDFQWGGCSVNFNFARKFAKKFLDHHESTNRDTRALMHLQNSKAGRKAVARHLKVVCQCHGVSGACSVRTCWKSLPKFRTVGTFLRKKYEKAKKVLVPPDGKTLVPVPKTTKLYDSIISKFGTSTARKHSRKVRKTDLVFVEASPDYCEQNKQLGLPGTSGRECNSSSNGQDSCRYLCCGRGYDTKVEDKTYKCNCKFVWCCQVKCETCQKTVVLNQCKSDNTLTLGRDGRFIDTKFLPGTS